MHLRHALLLAVVLLTALALGACKARQAGKKDYNKPLRPGDYALRPVSADRLPAIHLDDAGREALLKALDHSAAFLAKPSSAKWYTSGHNVSREEAVRSVAALKELVQARLPDEQFNQRLKERFQVLMSVGCDDDGTVLFTGYYTPIFNGALERDAIFRHPVYACPDDLVNRGFDAVAGRRLPSGEVVDYPNAAEIEATGMLKGRELVWLADPFDAYLIRVQGSAKIRLPTGELLEIGYKATNGHAYQGIGGELVKDGRIPADRLSFATLREYFRAHPEQVADYTRRNPRYVFFQRSSGGPFGCLNVPVTADVSIATDKAIFPPGAPVVVATRMADPQLAQRDYTAIRVDQDRGGAIRAPGRCDLFMGEGDRNEARAGMQLAEGRMFYLIARE